MTEYEIKEIVKDYIRNNLSVEFYKDYQGYERTLKVEIRLNNEVISSCYEYID
jgi:hypothetical protein